MSSTININLNTLQEVQYVTNGQTYYPDALELNGTTIWRRASSAFCFTGIDSNGFYDVDFEYDGTPVAYALGSIVPNYTHAEFTEVSPIPTTNEDYADKYYPDPDNSECYSKLVYNSSLDTLSVDGTVVDVVAGTTKCYNRMTTYSYTLKNNCKYYKYLVNPQYTSFTTNNDYIGYWVSDDTNNVFRYVTASNVSRRGITPGTTICYTRTEVAGSGTPSDPPTTVSARGDKTGSLTAYHENGISMNYNFKANNGLNSNFYGTDVSEGYTSVSDIPNIDIDKIEIPSLYNGKSVIKILTNAIFGFGYPSRSTISSSNKYYVAYKTTKLSIPSSVQTLNQGAIYNVIRLDMTTGTPRITTDGITYGNGSSYITLSGNTSTYEVGCLADVIHANSPQTPITIPRGTNAGNSLTIKSSPFVFSSFSDVSYPPLNTIVLKHPNIILETQTFPSGNNNYNYYLLTVVDNLIISDTVTSLSGKILGSSPTTPGKNLVFLHGSNAQISLSVEKNKSATSINIYTDCQAVRNYDWSSQGYTVTFYNLNEYPNLYYAYQDHSGDETGALFEIGSSLSDWTMYKTMTLDGSTGTVTMSNQATTLSDLTAGTTIYRQINSTTIYKYSITQDAYYDGGYYYFTGDFTMLNIRRLG